jgi:hypothetical protein
MKKSDKARLRWNDASDHSLTGTGRPIFMSPYARNLVKKRETKKARNLAKNHSTRENDPKNLGW